MRKKSSELDFEEYIRQVEPAKREKSYAWSTAIGLQQVDGLTPSDFLLEIAKKNIEGEISLNEAQALIDSYYESSTERTDDNDETEEADKVSVRTAQVLSENAFSFTPSFLIAIHKRLFDRVLKNAGEIRKYNISKKEWVLNGDSVMYGASFELRMALDYDFEREREFNYSDLSMDEIVRHLSSFVSRLWQIHAFGEGNTRTIAVFTIKYLRFMGFKVGNDIFAKNSWYFRNALVRANYKNVAKGIQQEPEYLEKFFRNLLMGEHNELKNRYLHVKCLFSPKKSLPEEDSVSLEDTEWNKKMSEDMTSGKAIRADRGLRGWTQKVLAEKLGVSIQNLSAMEHDRRPVSKKMALKLSEIFGVPPESYFKF
jgi:fido (protein-threonine AMPylation protein)/DNA-binding XRE family transcriptional regulator